MPRMIATHPVKDVDQWLASYAKVVEFFAPFASEIVMYTVPDGGNTVAIALNVHDMDGLWAAHGTPAHQALREAGGVLDPAVLYMQAAG
jgi:hypothetical protein